MRLTILLTTTAWCLAAGSATVVWAAPVRAQEADQRNYDLPAQSLGASLQAAALISGRNVIAPSTLVDGKQAEALKGAHTIEEAIALLLRGTGLHSIAVGTSLVIRRDRGAVAANPTDEGPGHEIVVTGTRIRGAPVASPVITLNREAMRNAGQASLGDVVRTIPQNFGGGQNPGIGFDVPETNGADVGGGASVNLRGLGSDATLTLLNGHRLSYSAARQSVDISGIPFGAVDRIEIVPDGASALFGSDAVAGVVNVILRRDLDGLETSARLGASTDGGNFEQQYAATAGKSWASGNVLLAYEYGSNRAIEARQRSYAASRAPGLTLYPALRHHSAALAGHQALTSTLSFAVDGLFNKRWSDLGFPLNFAGDLSVSRGTTFTVARSFGLAPSFKLDLASDWQVSLLGSYGQDKVDYGGNLFFGTTKIDLGSGYYRNRGTSAELSGNGTLFGLAGGSAKLALGAGYRRNSFQRFTGVGGTQNIDREQDSYYAFGELNLPLISSEQGIALVDRLNLSAAARYERYPGIGQVLTPKLGLIYAPSRDLDIKASWGRSFRAPTLYQQYQPQAAYLVTASSLGGADYPATSTALLLIGGRGALKPERSSNWSTTVDVHPQWLPGASLEVSYFSVRYRDRIVTPILFNSAALSDSGYNDLIAFDPSADAQAALIAGASSFANLTGRPDYDPADVVAIVDNTSVNAGRQRIHGIDMLARYQSNLGGGSLTMSLNASYLVSEQQLTAGLPITRLAGILYNPPHFRGRGEISWAKGPFIVTGNVTRIGPVKDSRAEPAVRIDGMTPVDLTLAYRPGQGRGPLADIDVTLSLQNIFNDKPAPIATSLFYDTPYDSTNYSPVGRFVSLALLKKW